MIEPSSDWICELEWNNIIDDAIAWPVAQTLPCLHSSQKRFWIFTVTQLDKNVV